MNSRDDSLWTALRNARPDPGYQPSPHSPAAAQMRDRALRQHPVGQPTAGRRVPGRRLMLVAFPAMALIATVSFLKASTTSPGTARPTIASVRAAILDAWRQHAGDISYWTLYGQASGRPAELIRRGWSYPADPSVGQLVRYRELDYSQDGRPRDDTESFYRENAAMQQYVMPANQAPRTARLIGADYPTRTWSDCMTTSYPINAGGLGLGAAQLRQEIERGTFTLDGIVNYHGRRALKLGWSSGVPGEAVTLLVDARTYEPLKSTDFVKDMSNSRKGLVITIVYGLAPATPTALRVLVPHIPTGFTRGSEFCH